MSRKAKDRIAQAAVYGSAGFTVLILVVIIGFILVKGLPGINIGFLTRDWQDTTTYAIIRTDVKAEEIQTGTIDGLGVTLEEMEKGLEITSLDKDSVLKNAVNVKGAAYELKKGDYITKVQEEEDGSLRLKVVRPGGGIVPMVVTTLYMIILALVIAAPIGILSAVYLIEYAKPGKLMTAIHFAIENLAGIPSIIYGLFGNLFFVKICQMQYSILAGAMTLSIILLPTIINTTEEALKTVPRTYRESSLGLGATKLQTISKVVLPNALPGILVAILLSIGRIVGESAALLLTAGTVAKIPGALVGNSASGATLTIKMYTLMKEENDLTTACAIGIVLLVIIILLNFASKTITNKLLTKKGE
ncbi:MAG: phosphate ABC transporter permease PstA [Candidatus Limivivens sp.]|nr:phosphate ABC transporter permease PstA [Candidatus Limivivens sp.]